MVVIERRKCTRHATREDQAQGSGRRFGAGPSCSFCKWEEQSMLDSGRTMRRPYKRAKRWLVYALARIAAGLLQLLPIAVSLAVGRIFGRIAHLVDRAGRTRARAQLERALGVDAVRASELAKQAYENIGMVAAEIAMLPRIRRRFEEYVELPDPDLELLRSAYAEGRGVVFVTGHIGNWELLAQRILRSGFDGATVARDAPNPFIGRWLEARRAEGALETINRGDPRAARKILGALKRGALLGVLLDQDTKVQSIHVPFFGRPAATPIAAAELALRRNAPVIAGFIRRKSRGHRIRLMRVDLNGLDATAATALFSRLLEEAIREQPAEWVWFHDRWRTLPHSPDRVPVLPER
jgi:KDO2-lipid IV(A) lauroyltransferase